MFAELLLNRPLFRADSEHKLINEIFTLFGTFDERDWPGIEHMEIYKEYKPKEPQKKTLYSHLNTFKK